jgi:hypothetical protein
MTLVHSPTHHLYISIVHGRKEKPRNQLLYLCRSKHAYVQSKQSGSHMAMMLAFFVLTSGHSDASCGNHEALCALCHEERVGRMV